MTEKDRNLFFQLGLTFALLVTAVFLLKPALFWQYQLFLIGGLAAGFAFGWGNRQRVSKGIKYFTEAAILITLAWISWRIFKSTFLYKEVIAILIQGIIILEVIFSFNFSAPQKTASLRLLSLIIFMTSPIFAVAYTIPLAVVYLLVWLAILRFGFAGFLQPLKEIGAQRYYSLATSLVCFLVALLLAKFISTNVYLAPIKKGMFLLDEDLQDTGSGSGQESQLADRFYSLQEDLQSKISGLALKVDVYEKKRQLIYLLSELVKEASKNMDLDKAETGLIDILKRQGIGLEGAQQGMDLTKGYLDQKNSRNLQQKKEELVDKLKKLTLGVLDKIKITSLANKLQQSNSYQQLQENSQGLQNAIANAPLRQDAVKELSTLARSLSDLKTLQLYRRKIQNLEQGPPSSNEELAKKIADVVSEIKHTQSLDGFKRAAEKIRQLKNDSSLLQQKSAKELLQGAQDASRMKLDLLLAQKSDQLREEVLQKQDLGSLADKFDKKMDGAQKAKDHQEFIQEFAGLSQQNQDNNLGLTQELKEWLDLKTEFFKQKELDKLDNLLGKNLPAQAKQEIQEATQQMEEQQRARDLERQLEELAGKIKELEKKGSLSPENAAELLKSATDLKDLLEARLKAETELKKPDSSQEGYRKSDYLEQLEQAVDDSSLSDAQKEMLKALSDQLQKAQSLSQLEEVKEALEKEVSALGQQELSDQDRQNLSADANKISVVLENKISKLEQATAQQIGQLQEFLKSMQQSQDARQLEKAAQEFKAALKTMAMLDKPNQDKMLAEIQELKERLEKLLEKNALTNTELEEINKLNEKIKQTAQIKQQFLASKTLASISGKIDKLQDEQLAQSLEAKVGQLSRANFPEGAEKIILDLKMILDGPQNANNDKNNMQGQTNQPKWKIYILSSGLVVAQGKTVPLKVIAVDRAGYIKELTSDVEWFSTEPQVARVDDLNFLHPLTQGKTKIKAVYKGSFSPETEINVVQAIDPETAQRVKQELARQGL
ncbi:MAG: hypothetical protein V1830_03075 [Candidatus Omnitrophota bacterium]